MDAPRYPAEPWETEPRSRRRIVAVAVGVPLAVLLVALWSERRPIASHFVDRELRARGVPARYTITAIGPGVERIENVAIGDPAAPDLVARSVTVRLRYGLTGLGVGAIEADGVRLHGRLIDGHVHFGAIDRLLPAPSNTPFALPDIALRLRDARMRLDTDAGAIGVSLAGEGNLARSFSGALAAVAPRLMLGSCTIDRAAGYLAIRTTEKRPSLRGPLRFGGLSCRAARSGPTVVDLDVAFDEALAHWSGGAGVLANGLAAGGARLAGARAQVRFAGDANDTEGRIDLGGIGLSIPTGSAASLGAAGSFGTGPASFVGDVRLGHATLAPRMTAALGGFARAAAATPAGPLASALAIALSAAGRDAVASAHLTANRDNVRLDRAAVTAASGARLRFAGKASYVMANGAIGLAGTLATEGGGLPQLRLAVDPAPGGEFAGTATLAPYAAGGARLALAPVRLVTNRGALHIATTATLDGPLGGGRIEGLAVPLGMTVRNGGGFAFDPGCVAVGFRTLAIAGTRFAPARLRACPTAGASVLASGPGGVHFGARFDPVRLGGSVGTSPLSVAAGDLTVGTRGFAASGVAVRLGPPERLTRLDLATLDGAFGAGGIAGHLAGGAGQIGAVPLLMTDVVGDWTLRNAVLALKGKLQVADAQTAAPRFEPLVADDVALDLTNGVIHATGTLRQPKTRDTISTVAIVHDLSTSTGNALLGVRGIAFTPLLQPEMLTKLTLGLVADVRGSVAGEGHIRWTPEGVTSDGDFETSGTDLSAAFGPVKGIKGKIHFSDLLALETPPGQVATIAEANPGVAVTDGVVHYRLLAGQRIVVEAGRWPFAGGALILEPTVMDFSHDVDRHLTFTVQALDAAKFIEQLALPNVSATGTFDGTMPMIFDQRGGRIEGGRLVVRKGGGTLAYVGEITKAQLGAFGKLAFDALKSIRYQNLSIDLAGRLDGELVSRVNFNGVNQQPLGTGTPFKHTLQKLPFTFNITIRAPFRGLLGSAENFIDPGALVRSSIAQPPAAQPSNPAPAATPPAVQPPESGAKP